MGLRKAREMKKENIVIEIMIAMCILMAIVVCARETVINTQKINEYPATFIVTHVHKGNKENEIFIKNYNGDIFSFKDTNEWEINDIVSAIMDSKGTPVITDDEIVSNNGVLKIRYSGHLEER